LAAASAAALWHEPLLPLLRKMRSVLSPRLLPVTLPLRPMRLSSVPSVTSALSATLARCCCAAALTPPHSP